MKKVLIYGLYGLDNLGDDYMRMVINDLLKTNNIKPLYVKRKEIENYFEMENTENIEIPIFMTYKNKIIKLFKIIKWMYSKKSINEIDAIIFMGGGYTREKSGLKNLISLLTLKKKFKKSNKKIYFTGQTVGPGNSFIYKCIIRGIYKGANQILVREIYSKTFLDELKIPNLLVGDDAFLTNDIENCIKCDRIIFNYKDFNGYEKYETEYFNFLLNIAKESKKEIFVIPFRHSEYSKEYKENYKLYKFLLDNDVNAKFIVERKIENFQQIFKSSQMIISTAYHAIVLGLMFGNVVYSAYLGDYYKVKIKGILKWYDYDNTNCIDILRIKDNPNVFDNKLKIDFNEQLNRNKEIKNNVMESWKKIINEINA